MRKGGKALNSGTRGPLGKGVIPALERSWRPHSTGPGAFVDEDAVTLRLAPVRRRPGWSGLSPIDLPTVVGGAVVALGVWLAFSPSTSEPTTTPTSRPSTVAQVETSFLHPEPVLASGLSLPSDLKLPRRSLPDPTDDEIVIFDDTLDDAEIVIFDDTVDDAEIIIFDDTQPPAESRRSARRSRRLARRRTKQGQRARRRGDFLEARRHFQAALQAWPSHAPAAAALAKLFMQDRHYGKALRYAKRASRAAPRRADYLVLLGDAYSLTQKPQSAKQAWQKALASGSATAKLRL